MEGGGVSGGEEVASAKGGERELSEVREAACGTEGHPGCGNVGVDVYVVGWEPLFIPTGLLTLSCGSDRLFTSPLIKINGPSLLLGISNPFIRWGRGRLSGPRAARTLTVLEQSSVQLWRKVSTPGSNK